jgi:DNA gyrase subunit B
LADCQEKDPAKSEVFIVEGESAGGSAKTGRDRKYQAILPIFGKILNTEKSRFDKVLDSEKIGTLITALGTGIGKEDFDINKLRYHKVILMADADVDGSHIRTLYMTFFYRHMPQIVEGGYLYIAQPPLYKVKKGNSETYIKNETMFSEYIINNALNDASLKYGNKVLIREELEAFVKSANLISTLLNSLTRYTNLGVLEAVAFADAFSLKIFDNPELLKKKAIKIVERLEQNREDEDMLWSFDIENPKELKLIRKYRGVDSEFIINPVILGKPEALEIAKYCKEVYEKFGSSKMIFIRKDESFQVKTPVELMDIINQTGQKGISIQRFKGLGEMNAEQLWETTLNPDNRTLLKVTIDDAMEAEETFATLMGSVVEPRRDFIQNNALKVVNLDI